MSVHSEPRSYLRPQSLNMAVYISAFNVFLEAVRTPLLICITFKTDSSATCYNTTFVKI